MDLQTKQKLVKYLGGFISENRRALFNRVLEQRTRRVTVILEDIYQPQNASAAVRTCDCFGVQDLHIIENTNSYRINPKVTLGSSKWVNLIRYNRLENNTRECIESVKASGYRIIATTPHRDDISLENLAVEGKTAFLFGKEDEGLSETALSLADEFVRIPMYGFTESYNISVSVAIVLYQVMTALRSGADDWKLEEEEKLELKLHWLRKVLRKSALLEEKFFSGNYGANRSDHEDV